MARSRARSRRRACRAYPVTVDSEVAGILLAAGDGTRLGRPKALVELAGVRLVDRGVTLLRNGGTAPVVVVTGAVPVELLGVITVHNPAWRSGMGSSLAAGLRALPAGCRAAVVALADQPLVGPGAVQRLVGAYLEGAAVAVDAYHGSPRNPVLLAREHWPEVIRLAEGDVGARPFLRAHPELVRVVECADTGRPDDIDTPGDLAEAERLLAAAPPAG